MEHLTESTWHNGNYLKKQTQQNNHPYLFQVYSKLFKLEMLKNTHLFSLKITNLKNIDKNILEISDQNCIYIKVTLLYFSTNQLKTQNKNILENPAQKTNQQKNISAPK